MNITDLIPTFEALKPTIAADFTKYVTATVERLLQAHGKKVRDLHNAWSSDGNSYRAVRHFIEWDSSSFMNANPVGVNEEYLAKKAQQYADDQIAAFTMKLTRKLGNLETVEILNLNINAFTFTITGSLPGHQALVRVEQSRIINVSPKGNLFHQWPALIYFNGRKMSEAAFKKLVE